MKKILQIILFAVLAVGCDSCKDEPTRPTKDGGHTHIMYLMANNNLEYYLKRNLSDAQRAVGNGALGEDDRFVAFMRPLSGSPVLVQVWYNNKTKVAVTDTLQVYDASLNSVSVADMQRVLTDVKTKVPSKTYGISFGSHATGWFTNTCGSIFSPKAIGVQHGSMWDYLWGEKGEEITRTVGQDGSNLMEVSELVQALSVIDLKYIVFDMCFMSSIEAVYDLRNSAGYIIASPAEIMGSGFPYDRVLEYFYKSDINGLTTLCQQYVEFYTHDYTGTKSGALSMIDCSQLEALATTVKAMNVSMGSVSASSLQPFERLTVNMFFDLEDYYDQTSLNTSALNNFKVQLAKTVLYADHTSTIYSAANGGGVFPVNKFCGLTTYYPYPSYPVFLSEWKNTAWYMATN